MEIVIKPIKISRENFAQYGDLITSNNINSASVSADKRLAMPGDNVTITFTTPENLDNISLNFANEDVVVAGPSGFDYQYKRAMYDNDTTRNFYSASACGADNRSKGCKIPFSLIDSTKSTIDFSSNFCLGWLELGTIFVISKL